MDRVAGSKGVPFVDLFAPSAALYRAGTLTSNGIHPNELGCFWFAKLIGEQLGWLGATAAAPLASLDQPWIIAGSGLLFGSAAFVWQGRKRSARAAADDPCGC